MKKLTESAKRKALKGLREQLLAGHKKRVAESGSDELRGKNRKGQLRAINGKDPQDWAD